MNDAGSKQSESLSNYSGVGVIFGYPELNFHINNADDLSL